jgi:hypothetical protein
MKYTTASGYERDITIRSNECEGGRMSIEEWIEKHEHQQDGYSNLVVSVDALEEFMKGKVLVDRERLQFWRNDLALHGVGDIETAKEIDAIAAGQPHEAKA